MRVRPSRSACSEDREVDALFLVCLESELVAVAEGWARGIGMLNSCGGGREITELAPATGMYPSGGILNERWDMVGLWFWAEMGRIRLESLAGCGWMEILSGFVLASLIRLCRDTELPISIVKLNEINVDESKRLTE